ncbi:MAG: transglutaminase family protein [Saprospiraceae bacterium]|nr:transglutaminase family protein [Saprospiraceae bacterium]
MATKISIYHKTIYHFDRAVKLYPHIFRLRPAAHSRTPIETYSFKITPEDHFINWQQDPFGNFQARVVFPEKSTFLQIEVELIARMQVINPFDFFVEESADMFPFIYDDRQKKELNPYLELEMIGPTTQKFIERCRPISPLKTIDFLVDINRQVYQALSYNIRMETGVQSCDETLYKGSGSCRDFAWLLVQVLRNYGLAARFVSGYLIQLTPDIKSLDGPSGPEKDFTDLHAWTEVYIPGAGWVGLDPTSGLFAGEGHIPLSCNPDYANAAPVTGATDICDVKFEFENRVTRIYEDPRVTKPYNDDQWAKVMSVGAVVEQDLVDHDVRLTMGGEPTFVSIDDLESAEWNTEADGPLKRKLAYDLANRLKSRFAHGGLLHFGQGKWYPGELLPRWQYGLYWRKDGLPIWNNEALVAKEGQTPYTFQHAEIFIQELTSQLDIAPSFTLPAYEDPIYWALEEGKLPPEVDPLKTNLKDSIQRHTLAQILEKGLNNPAGFILPLKWSLEEAKWNSCAWTFRRKNCFLIPGNSPLGLRLPLESLPKTTTKTAQIILPRSPFEEVPDLALSLLIKSNVAAIDEPDLTSSEIVETFTMALCIQERQGIIYVFLPPVDHLEQYLELIAHIEHISSRLSMPVRIEGYTPPADNRLEKLMVTPDPGVIEVNVHPTQTWQQLVDNTTALYEEAFLARLGTEKFMVDGRHTGTGGGNHVTLGGITPADSPFLRRPDLLRSLITYWQHHPALSYLFAGPFIGPTSQAPRVDEGRDERLYELEIAFEQIPDHGPVPFWLVDRIFRNLLVDITGNTHRAEFCIDKLYSPDSNTGRLGILEMRAFDMPPHKQMSLVQTLMVRALVAKFWKNPYKKKLIRWGTELHDKFLLPHFAYIDMIDVVNDLKDAGYAFDISWFDPFFEFRFPHYGSITVDGIHLEIRLGIEPWHVLGEELSNAGTARFVDSSLERIQVKISGMVPGRHILLCNGCRTPLRTTGIKGEYVAGVRYKAWNPPSALHPKIGVDAPLTFDILDLWNNKIIGGCKYFVSHPGGRSFDTYPINSYEAESRKISRFWEFGQTPSSSLEQTAPVIFTPGVSRFVAENKTNLKAGTPLEIINPEYPNTLDLRRYWLAHPPQL